MNKHGMNWITKQKRLAIYLRDGMGCAYCGSGLEEGAQLTLDHLVPRVAGGDNKETNLITACSRCNSYRSNRELVDFVNTVANYINHGATAEAILEGITTLSNRPLAPFVKQAKEILANRPTWTAAMKAARK